MSAMPASAALTSSAESMGRAACIGKFLGDPPRRYASAGGPAKMECAVFEIDAETGRCVGAEALRLE